MSTSLIKRLEGIFPPIATPFSAQGELALDALAANLARWDQYPLAGYVVCGSNGEAPYLTPEERVTLWRATRAAVPAEKLIIAGTGCEATGATIELSHRAADAGADAVLVLTPHYFGGQMTAHALRRYFEAVADACPVPVILYDAPKFTHVEMTAVTIAALAEHPNIAAIKDTSGNITKMGETVHLTRAGGSFALLAGSAGFFFPSLCVGAVGGILALANIAPEACLEIQAHFRAGRLEDAAEVQRRMIALNTAITMTYGIPGLKAAMDRIGYYGGPVRPPLLAPDSEAGNRIAALLQAATPI